LPLLVLSGLAACISLAKDAPEKRRFAWTASRPSATPASRESPSLLVRHPGTAPGFGERSFVIRLGEQRYEPDVYVELLATPADALGFAVRAWLAQSGLFASVLADGSALVPTHRLELELRTLHADLRDPKSPLAVVEIGWFLLEGRTPRLLDHGLARAAASATGVGAEAIAAAYDAALARALTDLERALSLSLSLERR
jgi:ABC-type uncharacterized transport system auxiliary subunit